MCRKGKPFYFNWLLWKVRQAASDSRQFVRWLWCGGMFSLMVGLPLNAWVQEAEFWERWPGGRELTAPDYARPDPPSLPVCPAPPPSNEPLLSTDERVFVCRFEFEGNTVFTAEKLAVVTVPYTNRPITAEELQEVRLLLTKHYIDQGYINSGAVIRDQPVEKGVVRIDIVEGRLSEVKVTKIDIVEGRLSEVKVTDKTLDYFQNRLRPKADAPLKVQALQERLQILQQNPLIEQLQAVLEPDVKPGESVLRLTVQEAPPYEVGLKIANNNPPSVGATRAYLYGLGRNLTGVGDSLELSYGHSLESSTADWRAFYDRPLNARDTAVQVWAGQNETSVIEDRFSTLDITSKLQSYGIALTHPLYRTPQRNLSLGLNLERRHSESYLLGIPFPFAPGEEEDGQATVTVARFVQEGLDRRLHQVIAARSTFSFGLDAFGATVHGFEPDGQFLAWLGQFQWARRFGERDYQLIFKSILQLANDPLLSMEKCALGGFETVRGYPANTLVRDECFVASLEFRVPVYQLPLPGISRGPTEGQVQLAAFADYGYAKNKGRFDLEPNSIYSAGLGIRWDPSAKIRAALYWGYPFQEVKGGDEGWLSSRVNFLVQAAY